jgi:hypothetical protein
MFLFELVMFNAQQTAFFDTVIAGEFSQILLTGEAGTGKTYILTKVLSELHRQGARVLLCAPTHMARINLLEKLDEDVREDVQTKTVASLLKQFGFVNNFGETNFRAPEPQNFSHKWDIIAIDECSMLSEAAYQALKVCGCRVIYTGDFAQLPVVMSKKSSMLDDNDLQHIHLTEQMRQQGEVHKIAERNREAIFMPTESSECEQTKVSVHKSLAALLSHYVVNLLEDERGSDAPIHHRFITHRNATVEYVNNFIREEFVNSSEPFTNGEKLLICYTTPVAANGEVATVNDVQEDQSRLGRYNHKWRSYAVGIKTKRGECYIYCIPPQDKKLVDERLDQLKEIIKMSMQTNNRDAYKEAYDETRYIRETWTAVNYPYAVTAHKSQGQTIENVYVNTLELSKAPHKRALTYVAFSRASKALHTVKV